MFSFALLVPAAVLAIPVLAIVLSYREKMAKNKIRELELRKEMLQLENENQNGKLKLLEEENRKYDRLINERENRG